MRVGVFLPNWIGDAVMATPALRALRKHFGPDAEIVGIMRPAIADVLAGTPWLDEQVLYDPRSKQSGMRSWAVARKLRARSLDLAMLFTNSLRTAVMACLAGAKERVGYVRYGRGPLLTRKFEYPSFSQAKCRVVAYPMVDFYLKLVYALGCGRESLQLELATTADDERAADEVWEKFRLGTRNQVAVFNSSGAFGGAKLWPVEHFAALARRVAIRQGHDVLVICGPSERETAARIVQLARHPRVFSLADQPLSIGLSKACVRRSQLMVTTDSGPRHFAVAFGVPLVGLFGPTPAVWGQNPTAHETVLQLDLDCAGCHRRTCPLGHHRCMQDLSVDRAFQAVAALGVPERKLGVPERKVSAA